MDLVDIEYMALLQKASTILRFDTKIVNTRISVPIIRLRIYQEIKFPSFPNFAYESKEQRPLSSEPLSTEIDIKLDEVCLALKSVLKKSDYSGLDMVSESVDVSLLSISAIGHFLGPTSKFGINGISNAHIIDRKGRSHDTTRENAIILDSFVSPFKLSWSKTFEINKHSAKGRLYDVQLEEIAVSTVPQFFEIVPCILNDWLTHSRQYPIETSPNLWPLALDWLKSRDSNRLVQLEPDFIANPNDVWLCMGRPHQQLFTWSFLQRLRGWLLSDDLGSMRSLRPSKTSMLPELVVDGLRVWKLLNSSEQKEVFHFLPSVAPSFGLDIAAILLPKIHLTIIDGPSALNNVGISDLSFEVHESDSGGYCITTKLYSVDVDTDINLLGFIVHPIRAIGWSSALLSASSHSKSEITEERQSVNVELSVETISASFLDSCSLTETHVQNFALSYNERKSPIPIIKLVCIQTTVFERNFETSHYRNDELVSFSFEGGLLDPAAKRPPTIQFSDTKIYLQSGILGIHSFIEKWLEEDFPRYYMLINRAFKAAEESFEIMPSKPTQPVQYNACFKRINFECDILSALKFAYSSSDLLLVYDWAPSKGHIYQMKLPTHRVSFATLTEELKSHQAFSLPSIHVNGSISQARTVVVHIGAVRAGIDMNLIDQVLMIYGLMGAEIVEIVEAMSFRYLQASSGTSPTPSEVASLTAQVYVNTIEATISSPKSSVKFQFAESRGSISYDMSGSMKWEVLADKLSISFNSLADADVTFVLAKLQSDIRVRNREGGDASNVFLFELLKMSMVAHPFGVKQLNEFIKYFDKGIKRKIETVSEQVERLKQETSRILESSRVSQTTRFQPNILSELNLHVVVDGSIISIPLEEEEVLLANHSQIRALLFGLKKFDLRIQGRHCSTSSIELLESKFIEDYVLDDDEYHPVSFYSSNNSFSLGHILLDLKLNPSDMGLKIVPTVTISDFLLTLNAELWSYVKRVTKVYYDGKGKVEGLFATQRTTEELSSSFNRTIQTNDLLIENASFKFGEGRVKILSVKMPKKKENSSSDLANYDLQEIILPGVLLTANTILGVRKLGRALRKLSLGVTIKSTENTFYPSFLQILKEMSTSSSRLSQYSSADDTSKSSGDSASSDNPIFSMLEEIELDIDVQSTKLVLSCLPVQKVISLVGFDAARFKFQLRPFDIEDLAAANDTCIVGDMSISNVSLCLKHALSPEECLNATIPLISSSLTSPDSFSRRIATVVEELTSSLNFRHIQDLFIFKYCWLRNNPVFQAETTGVVAAAPVLDEALVQKIVNKSLSVEFTLGHASLRVDFGHSVGKGAFEVRNILLKHVIFGEFYTTVSVSDTIKIEKMLLHIDGKLNGSISFDGIKIDHSRHYVEDIVLSNIALSALTGDFSYQFERTFVGSLKDLLLVFERRASKVPTIVFTIDQISGIISRNTYPSLRHSLKKIMAHLKERRTYAQTSSPTKGKVDDKMLQGFYEKYSRRTTILLQKARHTLASGSSTVNLKRVNVIFMRNNFRDPEFAELDVIDIMADFKSLPKETDNYQQDLKFQLGSAQVKKYSSSTVSQNDDRTWTKSQWFSHLNAQASKRVLAMPSIDVSLESLLNMAKKEVLLAFSSEFGGQIDVALNIGLYKYLQNLAEIYQKTKTLERLQVDDGASVADNKSGKFSEAGKSRDYRRHSLALVIPAPLSDASSNPEELSPPPLSAGVEMSQVAARFRASEFDLLDFTFTTSGEVKFDPQMRVTGDLQLDWIINWLGVNKDKLPKIVYMAVSNNIQKLLEVFKKETAE